MGAYSQVTPEQDNTFTTMILPYHCLFVLSVILAAAGRELAPQRKASCTCTCNFPEERISLKPIYNSSVNTTYSWNIQNGTAIQNGTTEAPATIAPSIVP